MPKNGKKRKKASTTSTSDLDNSSSNNSTLNNSTFQAEIHEENSRISENNDIQITSSKTHKQEKKKQKMAKNTDLEEKLDQINEKLSNVLTKDDRSFIRNIIKDTIEEVKEKLLATLTKRIEILENEIHEKAVSSNSITSSLAANRKEIEKKVEKVEDECKTENIKLKKENESLKEDINNLEQYGRRNNIRVSGIAHDKHKQPAPETAQQVQKMFKDRLGIHVSASDIDIAHRLGKFVENRNRPIILKFVSRQKKLEILGRAKDLKGSRIYINEDLTRINHEVLMSLRLKAPDRIERAWATEGKLFAVFKSVNAWQKENTSLRQIKFREYNEWINLPWPKERRN